MPAAAYVCDGLRAVEPAPSPNVQVQDVAPLVRFASDTVNPRTVASNAATGGLTAGVGCGTWAQSSVQPSAAGEAWSGPASGRASGPGWDPASVGASVEATGSQRAGARSWAREASLDRPPAPGSRGPSRTRSPCRTHSRSGAAARPGVARRRPAARRHAPGNDRPERLVRGRATGGAARRALALVQGACGRRSGGFEDLARPVEAEEPRGGKDRDDAHARGAADQERLPAVECRGVSSRDHSRLRQACGDLGQPLDPRRRGLGATPAGARAGHVAGPVARGAPVPSVNGADATRRSTGRTEARSSGRSASGPRAPAVSGTPPRAAMAGDTALGIRVATGGGRPARRRVPSWSPGIGPDAIGAAPHAGAGPGGITASGVAVGEAGAAVGVSGVTAATALGTAASLFVTAVGVVDSASRRSPRRPPTSRPIWPPANVAATIATGRPRISSSSSGAIGISPRRRDPSVPLADPNRRTEPRIWGRPRRDAPS